MSNKYEQFDLHSVFRAFEANVGKILHSGGSAVQRIGLEIVDITEDTNLLDGSQNLAPILMMQDYYFRIGDPLLVSTSNESSPMAAPVIMWAMYGGGAALPLFKKCWQNQPMEKMTFKRLREKVNTDPSYTAEYSNVHIIAGTETMLENEWIAIFMARSGKTWKQHELVNQDGTSGGNKVAGRNFMTSADDD